MFSFILAIYLRVNLLMLVFDSFLFLDNILLLCSFFYILYLKITVLEIFGGINVICVFFIEVCFLMCLLLFANFYLILVCGSLKGLYWGFFSPENIYFASASARVCHLPGKALAPFQGP